MATNASMIEAARRGDKHVSANAIPATRKSHITQYNVFSIIFLDTANTASNPPKLIVQKFAKIFNAEMEAWMRLEIDFASAIAFINFDTRFSFRTLRSEMYSVA